MSQRLKNLLLLAGALTLFAGSVGAAGVRLSDIVDGGLISTSTDRAVAVRSGTTDELVSFGTLAAQSGTFSGTSSGTNTGDVTLSGQSYISLAGQALTANAVDLSGGNVTGTLAASHLPTPTSSTLGGVNSFLSSSHNFLTGLNTSGVFLSARPACGDLSDSSTGCTTTVGSLATLNTVNNGNWSGTALSIGNGGTGQTASDAAFNALSPLTTGGDILFGSVGGVGTRLGANATATNKYLQSVSSGNPAWAQVAFSDLSGSATGAQLPNPSATTLGGVQSFASAANNFLTGLSTSGTFMSARPVCGNLSDSTLFCSATAAQATAGLNTFSSALAGLAPNSGGGTANFLRADGTWTAPGGTGTVTTTGTPASGNLTQFSGGTSITNGDLSGDATTSGTLVTTVSKINGNPLGTTTPTSGNVLVAGGTSWATTTLSGGATLASTGVVTLGNPSTSQLGGVNSFASAANNFLTGVTTSGTFMSARPTCGNLSDAAASCSTDATVATNITSGRLPAAQLPTLAQGNIWIGDTASFASAQAITGDISLTSGGVVGVTKINGATLGTTTATSGNLLVAGGSSWATTAMSGGATMISTGLVTLGNPAAATKGGVQSFASAANNYLTGLTTSGALISARPTCGNLSDAAASCSTDATNAANISSGTIPSARLGVVGGTYRGDAITAAQTIVLVQYAPYAFTINTLKNLGTVAGTVTGDLKINTTAVTGCSSLALVSAAVASTSCTAANVVAAGDKVSFVTSSPSSLTGLLAFSMIATRN